MGESNLTFMGGVKKERYDALNGLRVLACIGIVAMHVKANIDYSPTANALTDVISFAGDFVLMFMMVSAFSMCCGYFERFQNRSISMESFYKKRYTRILPFFVLLVIIDVLKTLASEGFTFSDVMVAELWESYADVTLLFGLIPNNGISVVGVGWFLGVIFLFYLFFPFFTFILQSKKRAWMYFLIGVGLYFAVKCYFNPVKGSTLGSSSFVNVLSFFIAGGIIYLYRKSLVKIMSNTFNRILVRGCVLGYTFCFFIFTEYRFELSNLILYALWLIYAVGEVTGKRKTTFFNNPIMAFLSEISMEVYLCHMMVFRLIEKLHLEDKFFNTDLFYYISFILTLMGAVSMSFVWKKWVEPKVLMVLEK